MHAADGTPYANVMNLLLDAVCVVDVEGRYLYVNAAFEQIFGYTPAEVLGRPMSDLVHPEDRERTLQMAAGIMQGYSARHFENRYLRKDGQVAHIMWSARWSEADQARVAVARDVTEKKRAEARQAALHSISTLAHSSEDFPSLFRLIHKALNEVLPSVSFLVAFHDAQKDELSFPYCGSDQTTASLHPTSHTRLAEVVRSAQVMLLNEGGEDGAGLSWLGAPLRGQNEVIGALALLSQSAELRLTEKEIDLLEFVATQMTAAILHKQMLDRLQHSALHDQLTDLPNRKLFHDRLQTALALARRDQMRLALLYLDLDLFKQVNDTYGHAIGDLLLQEVAVRLRQCVRDSDTVGRIGGDEFLLMLNGINSPLDAQVVAEKVAKALCQPFIMAGQQLLISPSIGIALYPEHANDHLELIQNADQAMYRAKKAGGNTFHMA